MDLWSWLQEVALLIVVYKITSAESDLLESIRPKADNPPELNDFLSNVLEHKSDFYFAKQAARKYQKMKKDTQYSISFDSLAQSSLDYDNSFQNRYEDKRSVHHQHKRLKNVGFIQPSFPREKFRRIRRGLKKHFSSKSKQEKSEQKRVPVEIIMLQEEDNSGHVHSQQPMIMHSGDTKKEKHIPSKIFIEPLGEKMAKRTLDITVEPEGKKGEVNVGDSNHQEKKEAMDFSSEAVHRTYKSNPKSRTAYDVKNKQNDVYYVDLGDAAERNMDRYDRRRYGWAPRRHNLYFRPGDNRMFSRPMLRPDDRSLDYPYENAHHSSLTDDVGFEKALSYEIDPRYQEDNYNNPEGNSLYSVDEGPPDMIEPVYPYRNGFQGQGDFLDPAISNERFYINNDDNLKKLDSSTTESTTSTGSLSIIGDASAGSSISEKKTKDVKHIGNGFIEITKAKRDEEQLVNSDTAKDSLPLTGTIDEDREKQHIIKESDEKDKDQTSSLLKHSLHPLRVRDTESVNNKKTLSEEEQAREKRDVSQGNGFKTRKLQFIDDQMSNMYEDANYNDVPIRARRDFLDALGMKNEEDYSEDNPYKDELKVNNTDVHNDTHIHNDHDHNDTTPRHSCSSTVKTTTTCPVKEDIKSIKKILEEPKDMSPGKKNKEKHARKRLTQVENFDDSVENNVVLRTEREDTEDVEDKIRENKEKIYNAHEDKRNNNIGFRQERMIPKWPMEPSKLKKSNVKKSIKMAHRINKKEYNELPEMKAITNLGVEITTSTMMTTYMASGNDSENVNSSYEKIAQQMDEENEKLAQVVNGHLASKIVTSVFDALKKKSCLKTKFYSGLSRKHVNFAGSIDLDIFKTNETEDVGEARLLLDQITKVLNRLVLNQVRRKLCQRLPDELRDYLDIVLNVKNTIETNNFVPNTNQGNYLFAYQQAKNKEPPEPFDMKQIQETLNQLQTLLSNYQSLSEENQNRAEPVKDYIEKHVEVLQEIETCPQHNCENKLSAAKRDTPYSSPDLVEKQLESVGLGKNREFIPNFDVNRLVKNRLKDPNWKNSKKRDADEKSKPTFKSQQYRKLQRAAERIREKRENEKKIAELFGSKKKRSVKKLDVDYEEPLVYSLG